MFIYHTINLLFAFVVKVTEWLKRNN